MVAGCISDVARKVAINTLSRRIAFVTSGLARGGAEAQLVYLTKELVRRGHAVAIYTLNHELDRLPELADSGVEVKIDQKRMKLDIALLFRLRAFIRSFQADLIQGFLYDGNLYGCLAGCLTRTSTLISERSDNYQLNRFQWVGKHLIRKLTNGLIANSHTGAIFAQRLYGLAPNRVHTVWNGIDLDIINKRMADCREDFKQLFFGPTLVRVAVMVGNIRQPKDYILALDVAAALCDRAPDWRVLFLGDDNRDTGNYKQKVHALHQSLPCRERIIFAGRRSDAIEIISQCDVLYSTSVREGFPNVVLEAMSVGVPVVSTEFSDIRQILPLDWQVIAHRDSARMANAIERAFREKNTLRLTQREWVKENATLAVSTDNFLAVCDAIMLNDARSICSTRTV